MRLGLGLSLNKGGFVKSLYGPEKIINGGFDSTSNWAGASSFSIGSGILTYDATTSSAAFYQESVNITSGTIYRIKFSVLSGVARMYFYNGGDVLGLGLVNYPVGDYEFQTTALLTSARFQIYFYNTSGGTAATIDNFSLKEYFPPEYKTAVLTMSVGDNAKPSEPYTYLTESHLLQDSVEDADCQGGWFVDAESNGIIQRLFPVVPDVGGNVGGTHSAWHWKAAFNVSGVFSFRIDGDDTTMAFWQIEVNGRIYTITNPNTVSAGRRWITIDAGTGVHAVKVMGHQAVRWSGYVTEVGATAEPWNATRTTIVFGDSFTASALADKAWNGYLYKMGLAVNHNVYGAGSGATGYVLASDDPNLQDRIISNYNSILAESGVPDEVIIAMGLNDLGQAGIEAAANTTFDNLRTVYAGTVYVLGPFDTAAPSSPSANYDSAKADILAAVGTRGGFAFIDLEGVDYTKGDAVHPDTAGHLKLGQYIGNAIENATINPMPELITNGGFDTNSDWAGTSNFTIGSGILTYDGVNSNANYYQEPFTITSGKQYTLKFSVLSGTARVYFYYGSQIFDLALANYAPGDYEFTVTAAITTTRFQFYCYNVSGGGAATFDNFSLKEVL